MVTGVRCRSMSVSFKNDRIECDGEKYYFNSLSLINFAKAINTEKKEVYVIDLFKNNSSNEKVRSFTIYVDGNESFVEGLRSAANNNGVKCSFYNAYKAPELSQKGVFSLFMFVLFTIFTIIFEIACLIEFSEFLMPPVFVIIVLVIFGLFSVLEWGQYSYDKKNPFQYYKRMEEEINNAKEYDKKRAEEIRMEKYLAENKSKESWNPYIAKPCPNCGRYKVRYANWDDKRMSVAFWGAHSQKIGKRYICDNCKNMW